MRNKVLTLLIILSLPALLFAAKDSPLSRKLGLQGGIGSALYVSITPIAAQAHSYVMGMPFSVDDALVQYDYGRNGRQIASWALLSNTEFTIKVTAGDLIHNAYADEYETEGQMTQILPYFICFEYSLSYYKDLDAETTQVDSMFVIRSESNNEDAPNIFTSAEAVHASGESFSIVSDANYEGNFLGTLDGSVYIRLANNKNTIARGGDYTATVIMEVTSK